MDFKFFEEEAMTHFSLIEVVTKDKLIHQGIFAKPGQTTGLAILWVHGLSGAFYGNTWILNEFARACSKAGVGFAAFNNRGHDLLSGLRVVDRRKAKGYRHGMGGAGVEEFTKCVYDIAAGVDFLVSQGFKKIILVGHSTGANKVCYFAGTRRHPAIVGVVLASPASDRLDPSLKKDKLHQGLVYMKRQLNKGKGKDLQLGYHFFPLTPRRFVSLFAAGSAEDVFDYGDRNPKLTSFSRIGLPLLVIFGGADEYFDRPAAKVKEVFDRKTRSRQYQSIIIPDALHGFNGKENDFVDTVIDWIKTL